MKENKLTMKVEEMEIKESEMQILGETVIMGRTDQEVRENLIVTILNLQKDHKYYIFDNVIIEADKYFNYIKTGKLTKTE